jgi:hypothetical protein
MSPLQLPTPRASPSLTTREIDARAWTNDDEASDEEELQATPVTDVGVASLRPCAR